MSLLHFSDVGIIPRHFGLNRYRTIPHEIGHYVDWLKNIEMFDLKSLKEKDYFTHIYVDDFKKPMVVERKVSFSRVYYFGVEVDVFEE